MKSVPQNYKPIVWSKEFETQVEVIDEQHQRLISIINDLTAAIQEGYEQKAIGDLLRALSDYTEYHFETEEWYFEVFKYDESEAHQLEHQEFVKHIKELGAHHSDTGLDENEPKELLDYLQHWLREHILVNDKRFAAKLLASGHGR